MSDMERGGWGIKVFIVGGKFPKQRVDLETGKMIDLEQKDFVAVSSFEKANKLCGEWNALAAESLATRTGNNREIGLMYYSIFAWDEKIHGEHIPDEEH